MFTGIVSDIGEILEPRSKPKGCAGSGSPAAMIRTTIDIGASIACSGVCLTVVGAGTSTATALGLRSMPRPRRCA